jgi:hypothetical protein
VLSMSTGEAGLPGASAQSMVTLILASDQVAVPSRYRMKTSMADPSELEQGTAPVTPAEAVTAVLVETPASFTQFSS